MIEFVNYEKPGHLLSELLDVQLRCLRKGKYPHNIVHVGSFDGAWDVSFKERNPNTVIYCIEPQKAAYEKLLNNIANIKDVFAYRYAIHPTMNKVVLYSPRKNKNKCHQNTSIHMSFVSHSSKHVKTEEVEAISLNNFYRLLGLRCVDLLRVNCEGSEFDIFCAEEYRLSFLNRTKMVCLTLHGKVDSFLTKEKNEQKLHITKMMRKEGFSLIYGFDFEKTNKRPINHVWQVWKRC